MAACRNDASGTGTVIKKGKKAKMAGALRMDDDYVNNKANRNLGENPDSGNGNL